MANLRDVNQALEQGAQALNLNAAVLERVSRMAGDLAVNLVVAAFILAATWFIAKWAGRVVSRALGRMKRRAPDPMLEGFLVQVVRVIVIAVGLVAVLQRLGVQTTSIIAVLGAASLAIGLALQGTLSNVAAGVMLLILRPYRVGDVVQVGEQAGTVQKLDLFTTRLIDANNVKITVPNAQVLGDAIVNLSGQRTRRIEFNIGIDYDNDAQAAMTLLCEVMAGHPDVLEDPAPWAGVTGFMDSSVQITVQAWVKSGDWWQTKADLHLLAKHALDKAGIVIPYPHQVAVQRSAAAPKRATRAVKPKLESQTGGGAAGKASAAGASEEI
jgi:small conductance mechanosensitive channel